MISAKTVLLKSRRRVIGYEGPSFDCYYYFQGWMFWSFGFHVYLPAPNIEIHLPFGFIRIGRRCEYKFAKSR